MTDLPPARQIADLKRELERLELDCKTYQGIAENAQEAQALAEDERDKAIKLAEADTDKAMEIAAGISRHCDYLTEQNGLLHKALESLKYENAKLRHTGGQLFERSQELITNTETLRVEHQISLKAAAVQPDAILKREAGLVLKTEKHNWPHWRAMLKRKEHKPKDVFASYKAWCAENSIKPASRRTFGRHTKK